MRLFNRKSELERLAETVNRSLDALSGGSKRGKIKKTGLIAGGLAGLTAGSAAISSLRRRKEGARDYS
ncbi:MAG TPA: hypothetical protein VJL85_05435 [Gaiellaceae bacterium]|jgi:hypothetical protein|nr:hypothetical protein [Gaiellaceae bacterium]